MERLFWQKFNIFKIKFNLHLAFPTAIDNKSIVSYPKFHSGDLLFSSLRKQPCIVSNTLHWFSPGHVHLQQVRQFP